jgi:hypothetical protein
LKERFETENLSDKKQKEFADLFANRLLRVLEYPTKDVAIERDTGPKTFKERFRNFRVKARMLLSCKKINSFDITKVQGYWSILKKCIHEKDRQMMNYLLQMMNLT